MLLYYYLTLALFAGVALGAALTNFAMNARMRENAANGRRMCAGGRLYEVKDVI
jgi:hypothetical protein